MSGWLLMACGGGPALPPPARLEVLPPGLHRETVDVPGVGSVAYTIDVPVAASGAPLVLLLPRADPPGGGVVLLRELLPVLAPMKAVLVAPEPIDGTWTSARSEVAAVWLTQSVGDSYRVDAARVLVAGVGTGGEGAWHVGHRHQELYTGVLAIASPVAGGVDFRIPVSVVHSDTDDVAPFRDAARRAGALEDAGVPVQLLRASGLGHDDVRAYMPFVGVALDWMQARWAGLPVGASLPRELKTSEGPTVGPITVEDLEPEPAAVGRGPAGVRLEVHGDAAVELHGEVGVHRAGARVPPGTYEVWADFGDGFIDTGTAVHPTAGARLVVTCTTESKVCSVAY